MNALRLTVEEQPTTAEVALLSNGLNEHAVPVTGVAGFDPLAVFVRNESGDALGGAWGYVNWNWLCIGLVWLPTTLRGEGLGRRVVTALEQAGRERGCVHAHLDTFSWQARPLYERLGYEVFATLDDYPPGQQRFYMKKTL